MLGLVSCLTQCIIIDIILFYCRLRADRKQKYFFFTFGEWIAHGGLFTAHENGPLVKAVEDLPSSNLTAKTVGEVCTTKNANRYKAPPLQRGYKYLMGMKK